MPPHLFIFDLDGTLIDSLQDLTNAVNHAQAHFGLHPLLASDVRLCVGDGIRVLIERTIPEITNQNLSAAVDIARQFYQQHPTVHTIVYPSATAALAILAHRKKVILTNKPETIAVAIITTLGINGEFSAVWGGDRPEGRKPSPDPLHAIVRLMRVRAENAVMIGDGVNDIRAAQAAGIPSLAVGYGYGDPRALRELGPTWMAETPEEFLGVLRKIAG